MPSPTRRIHLAALAALPACGEVAQTIEEATEIAAEGGVKRLRDPLRPAAGPPRVLVFALDGVGHDALRAALDQGRLPTSRASSGPGSTPPPSPTGRARGR